jgi:hypothetical protein
MESIEARNQKSFSVKEVHQSTQLEATTTGKIVIAVQAIIAVSHSTAKKSLPCGAISTHGKEKSHGNDLEQCKATNNGTTDSVVAHGKEGLHGKA